MNRKDPVNQYRYGGLVRLAEGTESRLFLQAIATGAVVYQAAWSWPLAKASALGQSGDT